MLRKIRSLTLLLGLTSCYYTAPAQPDLKKTTEPSLKKIEYLVQTSHNKIYDLVKTECFIPGPDGKIMPMKDFFQQSMNNEIAISYVKNKLASLRKTGYKSFTPLELAIKAVNIVWQDFSKTDGKGFYTKMHEKRKHKSVIKRFKKGKVLHIEEMVTYYYDKKHKIFFRDSTQTLAQFVSHKSGRYEGDCEDFSRSLVTVYGIMRKLAHDNTHDEFYSKLYKGLKHYQVIALDVGKHSLNLFITYNNDFSLAKIKLVEPQVFDFSKDKKLNSIKLVEEENKLKVVVKFKPDNKVGKYNVWRLYSAEQCYESQDFIK